MFRLLRYFSIMSGIAIALLTVLVVGYNSWTDRLEFRESESRHNETLARAIFNIIVDEVDDYITVASNLTRPDLLERPETMTIDRAVVQATQGSPIQKIKIFAPNGLTVYSSQHAEIGTYATSYAVLEKTIKSGAAQTQYAFRDQFISLHGPRENVNLIGTYVPITSPQGVRAVVEVHTDITANAATSKMHVVVHALATLAAFTVLYGILYGVVRRADTILKRQHAELSTFNELLETRVSERTAAAEAATAHVNASHAKLEAEIDVRRCVEAELRAQRQWLLDQQASISQLMGRKLVPGSDPEALLKELLKTATQTLNVERAAIWLRTDNDTAFTCVHLHSRSRGYLANTASLPLMPHSKYLAALTRDTIIVADDVATDHRLQEEGGAFLNPNGITSLMHVPFIRNGHVYGFLGIGHVGAARTWAPEEQAFASTISSLIALTYEERDRDEAEQRLLDANAELEKATRVKSEFLATMSHEIRTPMNGVLGMLTQLANEPLPPSQKRIAKIALRSSENLLTIINDILDVTKLENGKLKLESIDFELPQVIDEVTSLLAPQAEAKYLHFSTRIEGDPAAFVRGDPTRIRQVLFNLIGNAIKFTAKGSVSVTATNTIDAMGIVQTRIEVTDTGIGIPEDALPRMFKYFSQADSSTTRRFGGTGLGLAIAKQLVDLMGGRIGVHSVVNKGSTFWVELPFQRVGIQPAAESEASPITLGRPLHVLAAEDNEVNALVIDMMLTDLGCTVDIVGDGLEAVSAVRQRPYDLVLMDVNMPNMDGVAATTLIRSIEGPAGRVPIIALTANVLDEECRAYSAAGMEGFLPKPLRLDALAAEITRVIGGVAGVQQRSVA